MHTFIPIFWSESVTSLMTVLIEIGTKPRRTISRHKNLAGLPDLYILLSIVVAILKWEILKPVRRKKSIKNKVNMIALAILFACILGLLGFVVRLLIINFAAYRNLQSPKRNQLTEFEQDPELHKDNSADLKIEQEIQALVNERLAKMRDDLPEGEPQDPFSENEIHKFSNACKTMLQSTLNLLKIKL